MLNIAKGISINLAVQNLLWKLVQMLVIADDDCTLPLSWLDWPVKGWLCVDLMAAFLSGFYDGNFWYLVDQLYTSVSFFYYTVNIGCATVQSDSHQPVIVVAQVWSCVSPCMICGEGSCTGTGFFLWIFGWPTPVLFQQHSMFINLSLMLDRLTPTLNKALQREF